MSFGELERNFLYQIFFWVKSVAIVIVYAYGIKAAI